MTVATLNTWRSRKAVGDTHEERVTRELERRGWTVQPYGQGVWHERVSDAMRRTESIMRWEPDMIVVHDSTIRLIDCKGSMHGADTYQYTISRKSLDAHLLMEATRKLPIYYVFDNLGVATPHEVMQFCRVETLDKAPAYLSFPSGLPRPFDDTFGLPMPAEPAALSRAA